MSAAFWDSSALVTLCVDQPASLLYRGFAYQFDIVVWWSAPVEIQSALERLRRMGQLNEPDYAGAEKRLKQLEQDWSEIRPSNPLRSQAATFLTQFPLKAADSLQLAVAWRWAQQRPAGHRFLTADTQLAAAARQLGFQTFVP